MNLRMTISVLLAAWLAGCDSSSTTAGTSSETVTGLQILANSAETIVSKLGEGKSAVAGRASRASTAPEDWKLLGLDSLEGEAAIGICQPYTNHGYSERGTGFDLYSREQPAAEDGGACTIESQRFFEKELRYDSDGLRSYSGWRVIRWKVVYDSDRVKSGLAPAQLYPLSWIVSYAGFWRLNSGVVLTYDSLKYFDTTVFDANNFGKTRVRFEQRIRFADKCEVRLEFEEEDTVKAPVSCDGRHVGNFVWDRRGQPIVTNLVGQVVSAQGVPRQVFPEDSLGISLLDPRLDTVGGIPTLSGILTWRLMPGDTIASGDSIKVLQWDTDAFDWVTKGTGVLGAKGAFSIPLVSDFAGDTLMVSVLKSGLGAGVKLKVSSLKNKYAAAGRAAASR